MKIEILPEAGDVAPKAAIIAYQGRRPMTLTYPMLNRSRGILWLVTGSDKVGAFARWRQVDSGGQD